MKHSAKFWDKIAERYSKQPIALSALKKTRVAKLTGESFYIV